MKNTIVEPSRFNKISFGYGYKSDFTKNDKTPGPGAYEHPSVFKNLSASILTNGTLRTNVMKSWIILYKYNLIIYGLLINKY